MNDSALLNAIACKTMAKKQAKKSVVEKITSADVSDEHKDFLIDLTSERYGIQQTSIIQVSERSKPCG
uniref:Uncharacterized protein n=1 Tax=Ditylenchus dipsaci TaxID=166011 RepID=A0A915DAS9_9BILA